MLIDPQSPASELTIRAEIALRMVQANASLAGERGPHILTEYMLETSIKAADKFIQMLNHEREPEEDHFGYLREHYLDLQ